MKSSDQFINEREREINRVMKLKILRFKMSYAK